MTPERPRLAILGTGPTGLEAALAAAEKGFEPTIYEAGPHVAAHVRRWGHVQLFTPWALSVSPRARRRLAETGHPVPDGDACPTGAELLTQVLEPLAELPEIRRGLRLGTRVVEIGRQGLLKHEEISTPARAGQSFRLLLRDGEGRESVATADVVLDCTGSSVPNTLGDGGIPAPGERALAERIEHDIPDLEQDGKAWAGQTTLLVGEGHSAQTAALGFAQLVANHPGTRLVWAIRSAEPTWGAVEHDALPARKAVTDGTRALASAPPEGIEVRLGVVAEALEPKDGRVRVTLRRDDGGQESFEVDRLLALTGKVGDHRLYRQLQVHECYATGAPMKLSAALLGAGGAVTGGDCLAQTSPGPEVLRNPEPGFFILGSKSYGRRNDFLLRVGWQQVDDVFELLGD